MGICESWVNIECLGIQSSVNYTVVDYQPLRLRLVFSFSVSDAALLH